MRSANLLGASTAGFGEESPERVLPLRHREAGAELDDLRAATNAVGTILSRPESALAQLILAEPIRLARHVALRDFAAHGVREPPWLLAPNGRLTMGPFRMARVTSCQVPSPRPFIS